MAGARCRSGAAVAVPGARRWRGAYPREPACRSGCRSGARCLPGALTGAAGAGGALRVRGCLPCRRCLPGALALPYGCQAVPYGVPRVPAVPPADIASGAGCRSGYGCRPISRVPRVPSAGAGCAAGGIRERCRGCRVPARDQHIYRVPGAYRPAGP